MDYAEGLHSNDPKTDCEDDYSFEESDYDKDL